jgi:hypothetical protein
VCIGSPLALGDPLGLRGKYRGVHQDVERCQVRATIRRYRRILTLKAAARTGTLVTVEHREPVLGVLAPGTASGKDGDHG